MMTKPFLPELQCVPATAGRRRDRLAWLVMAASLLIAAFAGSPAVAGSIYGVYQNTDIGYPAVVANFGTGGAIASTNVVGAYFGGGAIAPLQFPIGGGLAYGNGALYGAYADTAIGYPAVLAKFDPGGAVASTNVIGAYFGGGAVAPLQYSLSALTYGNGLLYGVYQDTGIGYPSVLASIDPSTGAVLSTSVIGAYFGGGAVAPLQFEITGLAFGNGQLYGVYRNTDIGYPAVLATFDTSGAVQSNNVIGQYFGGGALAPLQYSLSGLTFGDGLLYGVYQDTYIGYPAVLAAFGTSGAVQSANVIGAYFGGGAIAPLQFPMTGLAFVDDAGPGGTVPEPATWAMMLVGFGVVGLVTRRRRQVGGGALSVADDLQTRRETVCNRSDRAGRVISRARLLLVGWRRPPIGAKGVDGDSQPSPKSSSISLVMMSSPRFIMASATL